jgi:hypothetical protein
VLRRSAVGAVVLAAVTACATSSRPGPAAPSGPASSIPAGTTTTSAAAEGPVVRVFDPFAAAGDRLTVPVGARAGGSCWTSSIAAPSDHTYRCFVGNQILDPCFAAPGAPTTVACLPDPWSPARVVTLTGPLPAAGPVAVARPWALELANGARCTAVTGVVPALDGVDLTYSCGGSTAAGSRGPVGGGVSTVEYGPRSGPLVRVAVTTVWRA